MTRQIFWTVFLAIKRFTELHIFRINLKEIEVKRSQTLISSNVIVRGSLHSTGNVTLAGTVLGDICCDELFVAEGGAVHGRIRARQYAYCATPETLSDADESRKVVAFEVR